MSWIHKASSTLITTNSPVLFWKQMSTQPSVSWRGTGDIHAIAKEGEKKTKQNTPTGVNSKDIVYWI